mgnify:CR=1 FL=1
MTTLDSDSVPGKRIAARQLKKSILDYMNSDYFHPEQKVEIQQIQELFTKVAGSPMLYTKDSPDELKTKIEKIHFQRIILQGKCPVCRDVLENYSGEGYVCIIGNTIHFLH